MPDRPVVRTGSVRRTCRLPSFFPTHGRWGQSHEATAQVPAEAIPLGLVYSLSHPVFTFGGVRTVISEERFTKMVRAVELGVDRDDFEFACDRERLIWSELELEFEQLVSREGSRWVAELV